MRWERGCVEIGACFYYSQMEFSAYLKGLFVETSTLISLGGEMNLRNSDPRLSVHFCNRSLLPKKHEK